MAFSLQIGETATSGDTGALTVAFVSLAGVALTAFLSWLGIRYQITNERRARLEKREALGSALLAEAAVRIYDLRWAAGIVRNVYENMPAHHTMQMLEWCTDNFCDDSTIKTFNDLRAFAARGWPLLPEVATPQMLLLANTFSRIEGTLENLERLRFCVKRCHEGCEKQRAMDPQHPCEEEYRSFAEDVYDLGDGIRGTADNLEQDFAAMGYRMTKVDEIVFDAPRFHAANSMRTRAKSEHEK